MRGTLYNTVDSKQELQLILGENREDSCFDHSVQRVHIQ